MTGREKFLTALDGGRPVGRVPHFELVFYLTMEAFGRVHPTHRHFGQWDQMSEAERDLHRRDIADLYIQTGRRFEHAAIHFLPPAGWPADRSEEVRCCERIRQASGEEFALLLPGDATYSIPNGRDMMEFSAWLIEKPGEVKDKAQRMVDDALAAAERLRPAGVVDGFCMCSDYCFNDNPFFPPAMFAEYVTPYLTQLIAGYREMGFYAVKHTDGNIMPILDQLVSARPHALHSLDPQGGVDIAEVKRLVGEKVCLIGNVSCALLDTGTDEEVVASARYALQHGMPGGGYVFATSNCVYTGMKLRRYELMLDVWRREGNYD